MPRKLSLMPAEVRDAAAAKWEAETARRRANRERIEKDQRCTDAVNAFQHAMNALWCAPPDSARPLLRPVRQTLADASKALAEAGRLVAWEQIDHKSTYDHFCVRNYRVMSRPSYDWAIELIHKTRSGQLPLALLRQTWQAESLRDAFHWLRIFVVGLSGEGAVMPLVQDQVSRRLLGRWTGRPIPTRRPTS
jgi:hypothetical protein